MALNFIIEKIQEGTNRINIEAVQVLANSADIADFCQDDQGALIYPKNFLREIEGAVLPYHQNNFDQFKAQLSKLLIIRLNDNLEGRESRVMKRKFLGRSPSEGRRSKSPRDTGVMEDETSC